MILPSALVDRWPADEYKQQHDTIESALKHSVADAYRFMREIPLLKEIENSWQAPDLQELDKQARYDLKRLGNNALDKRFVAHIIETNEKLQRCIKYSDYPAMVMAAYPKSKFFSRERFWNEADEICQRPVLLRGIGSHKIIKEIEAKNRDYYFIETGYLGNYRCENNLTGRKIYHRIVRNDMQHFTNGKIWDVPDDRYKQLINFNPAMEYRGWRNSPTGKVLVVLNTEKPFQYYGEDRLKWIDKVNDTIRKHTNRPIVWREKAGRNERTNDTIYDALDDDVWCLVCYNSIAAVEAVQYGIPAFALAPTAADPVCSKNLAMIDQPFMPDEDYVYKWLSSLAYAQFSIDEILSGQAWKMVLENDERKTVDR